MLRRALVVGCAAFLLTWHFLPRSPACRVVTISLPASTGATTAGDDIGAVEPSVRRFVIRVGSPEFKRLEELAAETRKTSVRRMPMEYYAEQWRMTAAQYYYERDLQQENLLAAAGGASPGGSASEPDRALPTGLSTIAPVSFDASSKTPTEPATFGSSYWQREGRQAKARQQALLANLPVTASSRGATIAFGELTAGCPAPLWVSGAASAAVLSALGMWWLQRFTLPSTPLADCRPSMQLQLPADWIRQSRPLGQRVVSGLVVAAWLSALGCLAMKLR